MYQCSIGSAPLYLTELLSRQVPKRQGLRSASSFDSDYDVPFNKRKTFSDRSFGTWGRNYGTNFRWILDNLIL